MRTLARTFRTHTLHAVLTAALLLALAGPALGAQSQDATLEAL